jgi:hypothetical protein
VPTPENPLATGLRDAGVTVTYLAASTDADGFGVVAPGVQITVRRQAVGTGPTEVVYTFGRSYARAMSGVTPAPAAVIDGNTAASNTSVSGNGDGGSSIRPAVVMPSVEPARVTGTAASRPLALGATARIYPVLVVGAIALIVGTTLLRRTRPQKGAP